jgi:hypothetical protein
MIKGLILTAAFLAMTACAHNTSDSASAKASGECACGHHADKKECSGGACKTESKAGCAECKGEKKP